jgi:microcystin-dependent protein
MPWSAGVYTRWNAANVPPYWVGDASVGVKIEATRHDTQDQDFQDGINACLNKDGSNPATGNLNLGSNKITNLANGTVSADAATFGQLQAIVPSGAITAYGAGSAPSGWLLCDGTAINRTTYATLFGIIGTTYGVGDGSTTFNIPNLQQRFPLGKAASGTGATLGGTGGAIDHTHTSAAHTHTVASHVHGMASHTHTAAHSHTLSSAGYAQMQVENTDIFWRRLTGLTSWNATVTKPIAGTVTGNTTAQTHGISLAGSTDSATPTTSGPSAANTDGTALTTDSTTPGATGANNPPFLVVNYIIKT